MNGIVKTNNKYKADCIIEMNKTGNRFYSSIKSKNCSYSSIINHTPRKAKIFTKNGLLNKYIDSLDKIIKEYISKRKLKLFGEDINLINLECCSDNLIFNDFLKVISYFVFDGTGKGESSCKANSIIYYGNNNIEFIKCQSIEEKKNYIKSISNKLILSLRDKGMPKKICEEHKPWIFNHNKQDGCIRYKGCLHIRLK